MVRVCGGGHGSLLVCLSWNRCSSDGSASSSLLEQPRAAQPRAPLCLYQSVTSQKHPLSSRATQTLSQVSPCLSANIAGPHVRSPHLNFLCGPRQSPALVHEQNRSEHPRAPLLRLPASSMNYGGRLYLERGGRGKGLAVLLELCSLYALIIY